MSFEEVNQLERLRRLVSISPEFKAITLLSTPDSESDFAAPIDIKEEMSGWVDDKAVSLPWKETITAYLKHSLFPHQMVVNYKPKHGEFYRSKIVWKRRPDGDKFGTAFAARVINACYKYEVSHVFALGYSMTGTVSPLHKFLILYWAHKKFEKSDLKQSDLARLRIGEQKLLDKNIVQYGIEDLRREGLIGVEGKDKAPQAELKINIIINGEIPSIEFPKTGMWLTEKGKKYWEDKDGIGLPTIRLSEDLDTIDDYREIYERMLDDNSYRINACTAAAISHRENMRFGRSVKFQDIVYNKLTQTPKTPKQIQNETGLRYKTVIGALYGLKGKKPHAYAKHTEGGWSRT